MIILQAFEKPPFCYRGNFIPNSVSQKVEKAASHKHLHNIVVVGARIHNLKNLSVEIPRDKLVVITGLSGSGKSSLAFDTLYAEGQRRYVESLSSYARQFLGRLSKPEVDDIKGLAPAIAIEQKVKSRNPRSTVGTATEIYDYLKLLYARIGRTYSPVSGEEVKRHSVEDVLNFIDTLEAGAQIYLLAEVGKAEKNNRESLDLLQRQGFARVFIKGDIQRISDLLESEEDVSDFLLVVDRIVWEKNNEDLTNRLSDSIQTAFWEGHGQMLVMQGLNGEQKGFSNSFELDGIEFPEVNEHLFSFNNPYGACPKCEGYGDIIGISEELVVPNKSLSVYEEAIVCWKGDKMQEYRDELVRNAHKFDFPVHTPYFQLSKAQKDLLWKGNTHFMGLNAFFEYLESKAYKIQYRVMLARYRGRTICPVCEGKRLRPEVNNIKVSGYSISDLVEMPIDRLRKTFEGFSFNDYERKVSSRIILEIESRLKFLEDVGLGYLTLNRKSGTLSGGESQRINLATSLGSSLVGSMYILDEPSIGLHSKDSERLITVLQSLKAIGNTVIVVEHDEDIIKKADQIIDIGPEAGTGGGNLIFQGTYDEILQDDHYTGQYLSGRMKVPVPEFRRKPKDWIELKGCREHNLKNVDVRFPLNALTVVTGVSGSGKSTLVSQIFYPAVKRAVSSYGARVGEHDSLEGALRLVSDIEYVDQNPIGKSSRSNPVTYIKAFDDIRNLFANQKLAKIRAYKPKHFSFNVAGGRCETCEGEGEVTIEMQFLADVKLTCESCNGKRFKEEILEVTFHDKNIFDLLEMTVEEAIAFFKECGQTRIADRLQPLFEVGLGYVHLGQSSSTLSGGEAQRVKLAFFLTKGHTPGHQIFVFDEPTTGLHFHDIKKLMKSFNALIEHGHSVVVIEHNMDVIKCADWVIDLGPEGGLHGGNILFEGTPEDLIKVEGSHTATFLKEKLK